LFFPPCSFVKGKKRNRIITK